MTSRIILLVALLCAPAFGACHTVSVAGSGTNSGADWNNAFAGLPATLVRGDSYYLADGSGYSSYAANTADSSTTTISIIKATGASGTPGPHCTDTGWNQATMGSGVASFSTGATITITTDYWIINGVSRTALGSGHGIKLTCNGNSCFALYFNGGANNTVQYLDIGGTYNTGPDGEELVRCLNGTPTNNTVAYSYIHDASTDNVLIGACSNFTLHDNYIARNHSDAGVHGQGMEDEGSSNVSIYNNVFEDPQGTGFIVGLQRSGSHTMSNWLIYNNVFYFRSGNPNSATVSPVAVGCVNSGITCNNWTVVQNDFVNIAATNSQDVGIASSAAGTGWVIENNLFYTPGTTVAFTGTSGGAEDYNSCVGAGCTANWQGTGTHDVSNNAGSNPFTSWTTGPPGTFTLASENSDWTGGLSLSSPYNIDPAGSTRGSDGTWERGAYEFNGALIGFGMGTGVALGTGIGVH